MTEYLSQTAFAKLVKVSRQAVSLAIKDGRIHRTKRGIDPNHPTNQYYREKQEEKKADTKKGKQPAKKKPKAKPKSKPRAKRKPPKKPDINTPAGPEIDAGETNNELENDYDFDYEDEVINKNEAEIRKIKSQTRKTDIAIAEKMRTLVLREEVTKAFGKVYSISVNHFLTMGDRLAPIVAGICGANDAKTQIKVKEKIDFEITRALEEIKRIVSEGV